MMQPVPEASFRLEHGFDVKPELSVDRGPGKGLLVGLNAPREDVEAIYVGKQAETPYKDVWIDTRGAHVLYVMGKRRSGKSYTLGVLAEGLSASTWIRQGSLSQGILILDTMNVYLTMPFGVEETQSAQSADVRELRKWKLQSERSTIALYYPRGASVPSGITAREITLRPSDLGPEEWCGLFEVDPFADPIGHLIMELYSKVAQDGYTDMRSNHVVAANPGFGLGDLLHALSYDSDLQRYHQDTREALRRRLDVLRRIPIFSF